MASCVARCVPFPVACVSFIGSHSPEAPFLDKVLARLVDVAALRADGAHASDAATRAELRRWFKLFGVEIFTPRHAVTFVAINGAHDHFIGRRTAAALCAAFRSDAVNARRHSAHTLKFKWIPGGHVSAFVAYRGDFVRAVHYALALHNNRCFEQ